ncbi:MAG TPA: GNAT family N-acetyltransferase [Oscillatoriaceae cyanobacterium M33_DOE_052]|uniref:GNAT family N-acetyltransferase n=1 Tax=Planktothricoides sp. SpSt-374 TaxID=2282167 RepID=A0A7C3VG44_9CYAN|nr:GNAT family N-acetyltransferase [Oscillatoriaceae cyanobacterium M33_DOE_052]
MLIPGYNLRLGSVGERVLLLKFLQASYQELYPEQDFSHLRDTVVDYLSRETPLWWVDLAGEPPSTNPSGEPVGCLWVGNVIDQVGGSRHAHIFLVYVSPLHRRRGIGSALVVQAESWARQRGDRLISLQVFLANQNALSLYQHQGYQTLSLFMHKTL